MTEWCHCADYRAAQAGAVIVHPKGNAHEAGDCVDAVVGSRSPAQLARMQELRRVQAAQRNVHSEPSVVKRLIRLFEEVLEFPEGADLRWYQQQVDIIKKELGDDAGTEKGIRKAAEESEGSTNAGDCLP